MVRKLTVPMVVLLALTSGVSAQSTDTVKPYIVLILDVSGSMDGTVTGAPEECSGGTSRFDHARCAIQNLVNTHGDVVFALARFRADASGAACTDCDGGGIDCDACDTGSGSGCTSTMNDPDRFELLVPLLEDNADSIVTWSNFTCGGCGYDPAIDPEMDTTGWTPIGGSLRGVKRYFEGGDPFYTTDLDPIYGTAPGDPIRNDPLKDIFLPSGEQCRPYIVITLTDGDETCEPFSGTQSAAGALLSTTVDTQDYLIQTKPIGFGQTDPDTQIEGIATAGCRPGDTCTGFYAQTPTSCRSRSTPSSPTRCASRCATATTTTATRSSTKAFKSTATSTARRRSRRARCAPTRATTATASTTTASWAPTTKPSTRRSPSCATAPTTTATV